jgi:ATP-dependent Clp protease adaptor protein ClpS
MADLSTQTDEEVLDEVKIQHPAKAILFNDEVHTFDEVINQIIKATGCDKPTAERMTLEVHHTGKSCVFTGDLVKCLQVTSILEEIELMTQVEM